MAAVLSLTVLVLLAFASPVHAQMAELGIADSPTKPDGLVDKLIQRCRIEKEYVGRECGFEKLLEQLAAKKAKNNLPFLRDSLRVESCAPLPASPTRQQRLELLRQGMAYLQTTFTDRHPDVIRLKSEIEREMAEPSPTPSKRF